jgi:hypothetical protein
MHYSPSANSSIVPADASFSPARKPWQAPRIDALDVDRTEGDPFLADDGLGDGLAS